MPLTKKGAKIKRAMQKTYGSKAQADRVFYSSRNSGRIKGVDRKRRSKGRSKK
jgi:hypothetical protein